MAGKEEEFVEAVIGWYAGHGDSWLPWRGSRDAWQVLLAALLLVRTTARQVLKVYGEIASRFPDPRSLLRASEGELEGLLRPLGMEHRRARLLKMLAERVVAEYGGSVPCNREGLEGLPGVGDYVASVVLLVACGEPVPLLDGNAVRVLGRVFGVKPSGARPYRDPEFLAFAERLVPRDPGRALAFNLGLLDLARKVCTARSPRCRKCPVGLLCGSRQGAGKASASAPGT
ncbi:A/G-specific adenine glycosylase [Infirmifilum lucidum]|uniref:A/G-specific adenine glycosylase n=1 Tax=Infirmifilum lucidum TaxID=2776706 RepID=A0A7L9FID2_9CREN|nr:A/G-specific adenine glycosylase [Infirmifilum lucidum]QOJ78783.1 A/G-specific adenine glycosylase [Infirmifilum lucidum]